MGSAHQDLARVELYWLPLGAGGGAGCVCWNGRIFEAIAPAWGNRERDRGVVGEGAVGLPWLGQSRFFRYEIRRWRDGTIPDIAEAVASPPPGAATNSRPARCGIRTR
jgi:hypothetical protein